MKPCRDIKSALKGMIGLLSLTFWVLVIFAFNSPYVAILTLICAIIHEIGHLIPLITLGKYKRRPHSTLSGFRITVPDMLSYNDSLTVLICGPCANLISFILLYTIALGLSQDLNTALTAPINCSFGS